MVLLAHNTNHQRTDDIKISQNVLFDSMFLAEKTLCGLRTSGFNKPSPIQLHGIPLGKCGFDLLLEAKSGTGKTAVFTIVALEKIDLSQGLQTIILAPTREIAAQICDVIKQIGSCYDGLCIEVVMGGLAVQDDIKKFGNNVHIVVGSPGRLRHLIQDDHIDVSSVRMLVLDEADKLMEKSFQTDVNYIFSVLPKQKQVIMSSATFSETSKNIIKKYVQNAQHVCPESNSVLLGVSQYVTTVKYNSNIVRLTQNRFDELVKILTTKDFKQCLIFCNYQARVGDLFKMLTRSKWPVEQLYGKQEQSLRLDALKTLQEYKCRILVSTDLAARGIDASNVDLVIHFEPPFEWQTYLHRIGRAGRFGSYGTAITILSDGKEQHHFEEMLGFINFPIIVKNFWTDDLFSYSYVNTNTSTVKDIVEQQCDRKMIHTSESDKIWEILTGKCEIKTDDNQNFESLCHSFDKSNKNSMYAFSDLLDSFQNNEYDSNELETNYSIFKYKELILDAPSLDENKKPHNVQTSLNSSSNCTTNGFKTCSKFQNGVSNKNNHLGERINDDCLDKKSWQIPQNDNNLSFNAGHLTEINVADNKLCCNNSQNLELDTDYDIGGKEINILSEYNSKDFYACKEVKKHKTVKIGREKKNHCIHNSQDMQSNIDLRIKPTNGDRKDRVKRNPNTCVNIKLLDSVNRKTGPENENSDYISHNQNLNNNVLKTSQGTNKISANNPLNRRNYDIWYKQLKSQMAHVQLALYFEELSKSFHAYNI